VSKLYVGPRAAYYCYCYFLIKVVYCPTYEPERPGNTDDVWGWWWLLWWWLQSSSSTLVTALLVPPISRLLLTVLVLTSFYVLWLF